MESVRPCQGCGQPLGDVSPRRRWHEDCYYRHKMVRDAAKARAKREASRLPRFCADCPASIDDRRGDVKYCHDCARKRNYAITTAWYARERKADTTGRICQTCPADISHKRSNARWCDDCRKRRQLDKVSAHRAVRRSKGYGFNRDAIFRAEIFARDDYTCHICGGKTSGSYSKSNPWSPVLDHIIPLGLPESPGHLWENAACAHKHCNRAKGIRVRPEDWALYRRLCRRKKRKDIVRQ